MPRLPELDEAKLSPHQRKIYDEVKRVRGQVRGPFAVWLRNAELAEHTLKLQDLFAARIQLDRRLVQLMILVSARLATAPFAWFVHEPHALKLVSAVGFYSMVGITLNAFDVSVPGGKQPFD